MKVRVLFLTAVVLCLTNALLAADDGQTQPKVNSNSNNSVGTATDLIPLTNGSGNVKGIQCLLLMDVWSQNSSASIKFYVNGGAAQTVVISPIYATAADPNNTTQSTGWVPFNVRFTSSIRVTIQKASSDGNGMICAASWGLD